MVAPCLNSVMRILSDSNAGLAHLTLLYLDWLAKQLMVDTSDGAVSEKLQSSTLQRWRSRRRSRVEATFSKSCKSISRSRVKSRAAVPVHRLPESGSGDVAAVPRRRSASPCRRRYSPARTSRSNRDELLPPVCRIVAVTWRPAELGTFSGRVIPANIINFQSISCQRSRTCSASRDRVGNTQLCRPSRPRTLRKFDVAALLSIAVSRQR